MNSSCVFLLALALFGVFADAYVNSVYPSSYGIGRRSLAGGLAGGVVGGLGGGMAGGVVGGLGGGMAGGLGGGFGVEYGAPCAPSICDTCQCVKTVIRPPCVERIPYACSRRVQPSPCGGGFGGYSGAGVGVYGGSGYGYGGFGGGYAADVVV